MVVNILHRRPEYGTCSKQRIQPRYLVVEMKKYLGLKDIFWINGFTIQIRADATHLEDGRSLYFVEFLVETWNLNSSRLCPNFLIFRSPFFNPSLEDEFASFNQPHWCALYATKITSHWVTPSIFSRLKTWLRWYPRLRVLLNISIMLWYSEQNDLHQ